MRQPLMKSTASLDLSKYDVNQKMFALSLAELQYFSRNRAYGRNNGNGIVGRGVATSLDT